VSAGSRRWGWHRLEAEWAARVVAAAEVRPSQLVLDLGAGTGALTAPLVSAGARVLAVELQDARAAQLRLRFAPTPRVRVVQADMLRLRLPNQPFRVVANPPHSLTAELLRRLRGPRSRMYAADLVLPAWAVSRWLRAQRTGLRWEATPGLWLPRTAFTPQAPVDARVLRLRRR